MQPGEMKGKTGDLLPHRFLIHTGPHQGRSYLIEYCAICQTLHRKMIEDELINGKKHE